MCKKIAIANSKFNRSQLFKKVDATHPALLKKPTLYLSKGSQVTDQKRRVLFAQGEIPCRIARLCMEVKPDRASISQIKRLQNRTSAFSRIRNRCILTGRNTILGQFRLSRISFRRLAGLGLLPGVTKNIHR